MKHEIIHTLSKFDQENYYRLYHFLNEDERARPFQCHAQFVDCALTLKTKNYPERIYKILCESDVIGWRINPETLFNVLNGPTSDKQSNILE